MTVEPTGTYKHTARVQEPFCTIPGAKPPALFRPYRYQIWRLGGGRAGLGWVGPSAMFRVRQSPMAAHSLTPTHELLLLDS